ncbi:MAG TPA: shikimate kinase [Ferruginibacter sp.]|nr:shikimate kinase [Ferruginibacter sp.]
MRFFLLGFMGTGKTYWGHQWAEANAMSFYDLDELIEQEENRTISDIFEKKGENYFRQKEAIVLRSLENADNCIIACGGGTPCFFDNLEWMNKNGYTISLLAHEEFILQNIKKEEGKRPLFRNVNDAELLYFIQKKIGERLPFYMNAKKVLNAKDLDIHSLDTIIHPSNY